MGLTPYEKIFHALNVENVRYLVIGGLAVNLYGIPRFTKDIEIAVLHIFAQKSR